jgi:hypothetical protein
MEVILDDRVGEGKDLKNMVRDRISNHGVMKDPNHRRASHFRLANQPNHPIPVLEVKRCCGFIEQQERARAYQSPCEVDPLLLPA